MHGGGALAMLHRRCRAFVTPRLRYLFTIRNGAPTSQRWRDFSSIDLTESFSRNRFDTRQALGSVSTIRMASSESSSASPVATDGEKLKLGLVDAFLNLEKLDRHLYR